MPWRVALLPRARQKGGRGLCVFFLLEKHLLSGSLGFFLKQTTSPPEFRLLRCQRRPLEKFTICEGLRGNISLTAQTLFYLGFYLGESVIFPREKGNTSRDTVKRSARHSPSRISFCEHHTSPFDCLSPISKPLCTRSSPPYGKAKISEK